jgi:hypothetical protein
MVWPVVQPEPTASRYFVTLATTMLFLMVMDDPELKMVSSPTFHGPSLL